MKQLFKFALIFGLTFFANEAVAQTLDPNGNKIIVSNTKMSVVKEKDGSYIWRTKDGRSGKAATAKDAKKAAREALKEEEGK